MGKTPGRKGDRRLADMTVHPPPPAREQAPPDECEEVPVFIVLAPGHELTGAFVLWADRYMIEFALVQVTRDRGEWVEVARIDTDHNKIHKHQLTRGSPDRRGIVTDIKEIPDDRPWNVIEEGYTEALSIMENDWHENLRRWRSDPQ